MLRVNPNIELGSPNGLANRKRPMFEEVSPQYYFGAWLAGVSYI